MLKTKSKILFYIFLIIILMSSVCLATDNQDTALISDDIQSVEDEDYSNLTSNWTNDDVYLIDKDIVIDGIIDGNVFAIGNSVTVTGEIGGDLFVIANTLNIEGGYIYSSIFGIAKDMNINGIIYDVYGICNNFNLQEDGSISRDLRIASSNVNIAGLVRRNAYITANDIKFSEYANTYIYGNLNYSSNSEIEINKGCVAGDVTYTKITEEEAPSVAENITSAITSLILLAVNTLVISVLAIWLTPKFVKKVNNMGVKKSLLALPIGLGALIIIPIIVIILLFTVIAVPVSLSILSLYFLIIAFSVAFSSMVISGLIVNKFNLQGNVKFVLVALASTAVIWILDLIPFVGGLVGFLCVLLAFGTIISNIFTKLPEEKSVEVKE